MSWGAFLYQKSVQNHVFYDVFGLFRVSGTFASKSDLLKALGSDLGGLGSLLGASWGPLGAASGRPGGLLGALGTPGGRLGGLLRASWGHFWGPKRVLEASWGLFLVPNQFFLHFFKGPKAPTPCKNQCVFYTF